VLGAVFYLGLSLQCLVVKNIAIKLTKLSSEKYVAIFSVAGSQERGNPLIDLLPAPNKTLR
jgi:hypothetical protein